MGKKNLKLHKEKENKNVEYQHSPGIDLIIAFLFLVVIALIFTLFYLPSTQKGADQKLDPRIKSEYIATPQKPLRYTNDKENTDGKDDKDDKKTDEKKNDKKDDDNSDKDKDKNKDKKENS